MHIKNRLTVLRDMRTNPIVPGDEIILPVVCRRKVLESAAEEDNEESLIAKKTCDPLQYPPRENIQIKRNWMDAYSNPVSCPRKRQEVQDPSLSDSHFLIPTYPSMSSVNGSLLGQEIH